jgi:hypothetical protein
MIKTGVLALVMMSVFATSSQADETAAREILANMAEYLAEQEVLSFDFDSSLEIITPENQKLAIASSGSIAMERPGKIHVTRRGGFASVQAVFDGTKLSVANLLANVYAQIELTGSIDTAVDRLRADYGHPLPGADLLSPNVAKILLDDVTDVKDLGSGVIRGEECDHLAFRAPEVDWQIWVSQSDTPYPCRYVITTKTMASSPQYTLDISSWGAGSALNDFTFTAAEGATRVDAADIPDLDEIAGIYVPEGGN